MNIRSTHHNFYFVMLEEQGTAGNILVKSAKNNIVQLERINPLTTQITC